VLDVLVTCLPHAPEPTFFPQVRGYYLAKHLARAGVTSEFRQLPLPDAACRVLICSEYQSDWDEFDQRLRGPLSAVSAERIFCLTAETLAGRPDHFSRASCEWFADRGGVLCHLPTQPMEAYEHWIGLGVDTELFGALPTGPRDRVLFDFPHGAWGDSSSHFDVGCIDFVRRALPDLIICGTGSPDSPVK